jgi:6-phosphogluconolactonase
MTAASPFQFTRWHPQADVQALYACVAARTVTAAEHAIRQRGRFVIVLAGGNTPRGVYALLRDAPTDWSRWHVYFGDERCTPRDDPARNSVMAAQAWLDHVAIPLAQVHPIPAEAGPARAAARYAATLDGVPEFDLVLLGLGEDGHTASLFPGHAWGSGTDSARAMPVVDAPKPPPERVTISARRLSSAREVMFMVEGEGKREAVTRWRAGDAIPASAIVPPGGVDIYVEKSLLVPASA